ncbi:winged helix-turn-helix domain-containing protein [Methylotenera sp. G11]|uniref:winged helix-turn-helix domain-containing protein n=1 Tax=Methylotenera sp. G11 TaxID=1506585 RepID=UPI000645D2FB|nr:LysR family transcriptional regulator [Methylotenera sp. G11]
MANDILKIRIACGDKVAMGPGKADLLEAIDDCGSISSAAKRMQMSYRRAWELVDVMNKCFDQPLVTSSPGGHHGGGAELTELGRSMLKNYRDAVAKAHLSAQAELDQILSHLITAD